MKSAALCLVGVVLTSFGVWGGATPCPEGQPEIVSHVVACREKGRYIGWPSATCLKDGTVLAVFSGDRMLHVCPSGVVQIVRSADGGRTWSAPQTIGDTPIDDRDASIVELPSGELLVTWFTSIAYLNDPTAGWNDRRSIEELSRYYGRWCVRSKDGGRTWSAPERMAIKGSTPHGSILLRDGSLLHVGHYSPEGSVAEARGGAKAYRFEICCERSTDGGHTWTMLCAKFPDMNGENSVKGMFFEPHVAELSDGTLVALIRYEGKDGCLRRSVSKDGGRTWSPMAKTTLLAGPSAPHLLALPNDCLVATYARRVSEWGEGEFAAFSFDAGATWTAADGCRIRKAVEGAPRYETGYPATVALKDGSLLSVYYEPEEAKTHPVLMATRWRPPCAKAQKFVLGHGWDLLDASPADLLENVEAFDKTGLDGVSICIRDAKRADGRKLDFKKMRGEDAWEVASFVGYDATMRELVKHPSMRQSMLMAWWGEGERLPWQDDAKWRVFCRTMATVATLAKRWNLPGLVIDPEDYNATHQFQRHKDDSADWSELRRLARQRGREMSEAIFGAYPACRMLFFWTFSACEPIMFQDPDLIVKAYYDLRFDFFNGMMDGLSKDGIIYDGDEFAYTARADMNDFYHHAWRMKDGVRNLVAPENGDRFDRQWLVSFGLYPDVHIRPQGRGWCFRRGPDQLAPNVLFSMNIAQALKVAPDRVWVYGERKSFIRWKGEKFKTYNEWGTWDSAIPGFTTAIRYAKDPMRAFAEDRAAGAVTACADEKMLKDEKGEGGVYKSLVVRGVTAGEPYVVSFKTRGKRPRAWVFWHVDGKFKRTVWPVDVGVAEKPGADGRWEGASVVRVPVPTVECHDNIDGMEVRLYADLDAEELPTDVDLKVYPIIRAVRPNEP